MCSAARKAWHAIRGMLGAVDGCDLRDLHRFGAAARKAAVGMRCARLGVTVVTGDAGEEGVFADEDRVGHP